MTTESEAKESINVLREFLKEGFVYEVKRNNTCIFKEYSRLIYELCQLEINLDRYSPKMTKEDGSE